MQPSCKTRIDIRDGRRYSAFRVSAFRPCRAFGVVLLRGRVPTAAVAASELAELFGGEQQPYSRVGHDATVSLAAAASATLLISTIAPSS